jgi:hypothetical protein
VTTDPALIHMPGTDIDDLRSRLARSTTAASARLYREDARGVGQPDLFVDEVRAGLRSLR